MRSRQRKQRAILPRSGRIYWATLAFLLGFSALIVFVSYWYLFPAMEATRDANPAERRQLVAHAWLLLTIIMVILVSGMILTFRVGRFFLPPRTGERPKPTKYSDAWAESGKRLDPPSE